MGFIASQPLNTNLFDWQARIVQWCLRRGRCALFADTGIGSEGVGSLRLGRKFIGVELKQEYFEHAKRFLASEEAKQLTPMLF
tara:strand:+ start:415 stop:663 length:249 start_codon:yes stop_codon:yes gene_type:complete